jgi:hypothetical protein
MNNTITQKEKVNKMNVKPKFLNVMKQRIFTLLMMLALVIVTGSAFAQSTPTVPYEGATHTYTVNGLTVGDAWAFAVNNSSSDYSAAATHPATVTINSGGSGASLAATSQTVSITWETGSAADGDYFVWIRIQDQSSSCYNYRRFTVNPIPNALDFTIIAVGISDENATGLTLASDDNGGGSICPVVVNEDYNSDGGAAGSNGDTYAYFRINRTNGSASYGWEFNFTKTNGTATIEASADGTTWGAYTSGATVTKGAAANVHYFRVLVATSTTADQLITGSLNDDVELTTLLTDAASPETDDITVKLIPTIGTFSAN